MISKWVVRFPKEDNKKNNTAIFWITHMNKYLHSNTSLVVCPGKKIY